MVVPGCECGHASRRRGAGTHMRKFLARAIGLLGLVSGSAAMAADMSTPVYKAPLPVALDIWSGFYGGFNAGLGISHNRTNDLDLAPAIGSGVIGNDVFN